MKITLKNWTVAGSWPYTVLMGSSVETGARFNSVTPRIPASVPGSVYKDLQNAGIIDDPYYAMNSLKCEWVANRFWTYMTSFKKPDNDGKHVRLVLSGIDYHAHVYLNDRKLAEHTGMFAPLTADITDDLKDGDNSLCVVLESAPDEMGQIGYTSRTRTQKSRFGYKWDFGTRLVDIGLYGEVYLDICDDPIENIRVRYRGEGNLEISASNMMLRGMLSYNGKLISEEGSQSGKLNFKINDPLLWYPNGYGDQPLYDLSLYTSDDEKHMRIGLRTIEYRQPECEDKTILPYIPVINGIPVYIKGVNMTPLDHMTGTVGFDRYERFIKLAKDANVNLIRVWGGGIIESEDFYDLCDRYGIMVWQEFIQSSSGIDNIPSKNPEFLSLLRQTAEAILPVKRNHASLTFLSGGNELMDKDGVPSTFEDENLSMLKDIADRLAPETLMLPTSASGPSEWADPNNPSRNHDIHGPWKYEGITGQYELYNNSSIILHSEFGVDGMSNKESLMTVLPPENQRVADMSADLVWRHHGEWWDTYAYRERPLFGDISDLAELCILSQYMQAEGIRYAVEAHRRRSDSSSPLRLADGILSPDTVQKNIGSIVWQFNEPWPNVSCTSLTDYYGNPKLAYYFFRDAEQQLRITLRYDKLLWQKGETFTGEVFLSDDLHEGIDSYSVKPYSQEFSLLWTDGSEKYRLPAEYTGNKIKFAVPEGDSFFVKCEYARGGKSFSSVYLFLIGEKDGKLPKTPILRFVQEYRKIACNSSG